MKNNCVRQAVLDKRFLLNYEHIYVLYECSIVSLVCYSVAVSY